jgi:hypothetical protein
VGFQETRLEASFQNIGSVADFARTRVWLRTLTALWLVNRAQNRAAKVVYRFALEAGIRGWSVSCQRDDHALMRYSWFRPIRTRDQV